MEEQVTRARQGISEAVEEINELSAALERLSGWPRAARRALAQELQSKASLLDSWCADYLEHV